MGGWELTSAFTTNSDVRRRGSPAITSDETWPTFDWYRTEIDPCGPVVDWFGGLDIPGIDGGAGVGTLLWSVSGTSEMSSDVDSWVTRSEGGFNWNRIGAEQMGWEGINSQCSLVGCVRSLSPMFATRRYVGQ